MSRVREVTAYQVWEQVTALARNGCPSSRVKYVEVLMDNSYHGIYALTEPVDAKQLREKRAANQISFTDSDLLYKINLWNQDYPYLDLCASSAGNTEILTDFGGALSKKVCSLRKSCLSLQTQWSGNHGEIRPSSVTPVMEKRG